MKTILRIIVILLVAAIVAGGFSLIVNNTSLASGSERGGGQPPAMTNVDGQNMQQARPDGGEGGDSASLTRGLPGLLTTLVKITGITIVVLLVQKAFDLLQRRNRKLNFAG